MDYKYTTTFESVLLACEINESSLISKASLETLSPLLPKDIDYEGNVDLLGVAFNAAVVNKFNKNGDGMDTATAVKYTNNFIHKPTNIEHDKQKVVGHIASAGYSEFGSNKLLTEAEVGNIKNPFNIYNFIISLSIRMKNSDTIVFIFLRKSTISIGCILCA